MHIPKLVDFPRNSWVDRGSGLPAIDALPPFEGTRDRGVGVPPPPPRPAPRRLRSPVTADGGRQTSPNGEPAARPTASLCALCDHRRARRLYPCRL